MGLCLSSPAAGLVDQFHAGVMEGGRSVATKPLQASGKEVGYRRRLFFFTPLLKDSA